MRCHKCLKEGMDKRTAKSFGLKPTELLRVEVTKCSDLFAPREIPKTFVSFICPICWEKMNKAVVSSNKEARK